MTPRQLQQSHQLLKTSATLSDRNSIYDFFFLSLSSLHLFRSHLDFFPLRILIYISRYCLSRSCAVRENKTRTVKNLIFPKADSCWRGSIGGKVFEVCSVTPHIKSSLHHASSSRNKAHTNLAEESAPPRTHCLSTPLVSLSRLHCLSFFSYVPSSILFLYFREPLFQPSNIDQSFLIDHRFSAHKCFPLFCSFPSDFRLLISSQRNGALWMGQDALLIVL